MSANRKRPLADKDRNNDQEVKRNKGFGSVINSTGKRIFFPKGMEKRYCADFLDTGEVCKHGDSCTFLHALYPSGFTENDKTLFAKHVESTEGLSFKNVS